MKNKILDCTLRDGGYYTGWDFSRNLVETYLTAFSSLPVDYLEIGYRSNPMREYLGQYFYCPVPTLEALKAKSLQQLVVILNEKEVRAEHATNLLGPCRGLIDMVRLAVAPKNLARALDLAAVIKQLGYKVGFNVMYMSSWAEQQNFLGLIKETDGLADYFYMVDSYGGVFPDDVRRNYALIRDRCEVPIGFHGHNNLELGLINTLTAIECGAAIVDATITGMGRGAGNLKTELLLTVLNATQGLAVDFNSLSEVVAAFEALQQNYGWGTNLPYMVSGANSLPQKEVMEWVGKRFYSFNSIIQALENRKKGQADNVKLPAFQPSQRFEQVVIVGGGPNAVAHAEAVGAFVRHEKNICLIHASSKNARLYADLPVDQYFCLVGNEGYRLEKVFRDLGDFSGKCVLPPYPREMGTYVPPAIEDCTYELMAIDFTNQFKDTHTAIAIQIARELGARQLFFVGYDGYSGGNISQREHDLFMENESLFTTASEIGLACHSLVPTKYTELEPDSVYARIQ